MRNVPEKMGQVIRSRREAMGLLQPQLAEFAGVSRRTIQLIEQGTGNPGLATLLQVMEPLGLTLEVIVKPIGQQLLDSTKTEE